MRDCSLQLRVCRFSLPGCQILADVSRETSQAAKSEEKRMFLQAMKNLMLKFSNKRSWHVRVMRDIFGIVHGIRSAVHAAM